MTEELQVIRVPKVTFEVGTAHKGQRLRGPLLALYGPEREGARRPLVGRVAEAHAERLQAMLDYADANMPPEEE